jgi:hypothetical protein
MCKDFAFACVISLKFSQAFLKPIKGTPNGLNLVSVCHIAVETISRVFDNVTPFIVITSGESHRTRLSSLSNGFPLKLCKYKS